MKRYILLIALFIASFNGCKEDPTSVIEKPAATLITGKIIDSQDKLPRDSIIITTDPLVPGFTSYITDTSGKYSIDLGTLNQVNIKVIAKSANYDTKEQSALISSGKNTIANFELTPKIGYNKTGTLWGYIKDTSGIVLSNATVECGALIDTTDITGRYEIKNISIGTKAIKVSKEGYIDKQTQAIIKRINPAVNVLISLASSPIIITNAPIETNAYNTIVSFTVTGNGGSDIIEKGICYNTSPEPNINNYKTISNTSDNKVNIAGLNSNTKYYMRAYIKNKYAAFYGNEIIIQTNNVLAEMVKVEGGTFQMGDTSKSVNAYPVHTVTLSSFYIVPARKAYKQNKTNRLSEKSRDE